MASGNGLPTSANLADSQDRVRKAMREEGERRARQQMERDLNPLNFATRLATGVRNAYEMRDRDALERALERMVDVITYSGPVRMVKEDFTPDEIQALIEEGARFAGPVLLKPTTPTPTNDDRLEPMVDTCTFAAWPPQARTEGCMRRLGPCQCDSDAQRQTCMHREKGAPGALCAA